MTEADVASSTGTDLAPGLRQRNLPHLEEKTGKVVSEAHEYDKKAKPKVSPFFLFTATRCLISHEQCQLIYVAVSFIPLCLGQLGACSCAYSLNRSINLHAHVPHWSLKHRHLG